MEQFEVLIVDTDDPNSVELLKKAYHNILKPAFPDTTQAETLDLFESALNKEIPNLSIVINLVGHNLRNPNTAELSGIGVAYLYEKERVGQLAYNAISEDMKCAGLGKAMVKIRIDALKQKAKETGEPLKAVVLEVNDPDKVPASAENYDAHKRISIFEKWGAKQYPVDYVAPPVYKGGDYCDYMRLYNYSIDGQYAEVSVIKDFLNALYGQTPYEMAPAEKEEKKSYLSGMFNQLATAKKPASLHVGEPDGYSMINLKLKMV